MDSAGRITLGKGDIRWAYKRSREAIERVLQEDNQHRDKEKRDEKEIIRGNQA